MPFSFASVRKYQTVDSVCRVKLFAAYKEIKEKLDKNF